MKEDSSQSDLVEGITDTFSRPLKNLRLSVTDRCNLRCKYCMPEEEYVWLPREDILSFEEMTTLAGYFTDLGVDKVRLTGGEPLLRRDLARLVRLLLQNRRITEVALTTNGVLLAEYVQELYDAGLNRITVSLDTLRPERFRRLTGRDEFARVLEGIESVGKTGFTNLKLDTVAIRGFNEDELSALIEFAK
ncbi:MAG TPA: radical SAM protein, partial [Nitrospira sp.]|nr:radical SAM protein [Nitrospira sp.]